MRKVLTLVLTAGTALTLVAGCNSGNDEAQAPATQSAAPSAPASLSPSASPSASPTPTPTKTKPPAPKKLKVGAKGAEVVALQQRLTELGYWNGKADGHFGGTTQQAVFALQKAAGIGRDGTVGPKTQKALDQGVRPKAKSKAGSGYLVEINLKKQLLMFVKDGQVVAALNTSTGSNRNYVYQGDTFLADTPTGHFKVGRQIDGVRHGPLGDLFRPKYFNGGIAVHGSPSIPPYPASHGCARVSNAAINWIWSTNKLPLKTKVWVYSA
jgi:peptidoglycan hydrolase-like protein with peptidoglycan-binding domain